MGLFSFLEPKLPNFGPMNSLADKGQEAWQTGLDESLAANNKGFAGGIKNYKNAKNLFNPLVEGRMGAETMLNNSLGLNGQEGYDAAQGAFHQGPGFQFALDQANQNVLRNNAAMGGVASGATGMALSDRAQQLQNLEFGNWQDRLKGQDPLSAIQSKASALQALGGAKINQGNSIADIYQGFTPGIAGQYNNQASLLGQEGSMKMAQGQAGIGNAIGILGGLSGFFGA